MNLKKKMGKRAVAAAPVVVTVFIAHAAIIKTLWKLVL